MSAFATLTQLRAGQRPTAGLLHTCRLHAFGSEVYGEEAIVERFRTLPYVPADAVVVTTPGHIAMFAGLGAIVADLADNSIARMWRVGPGPAILPERGVSVAFDPDLTQARGDIEFAATDHPALAVDATSLVEAIARDLARDDRACRVRAFVIRAFGTADEGAALFALHILDGDVTGGAGFVHVAARWSGDERIIVRDAAGEAAVAVTPWTPHIVA